MLFDRHDRWTWMTFADSYIRNFKRRTKPNKPSYKVIHSYERRGGGQSQLVQFDEALSPDMFMEHRVARSFAPIVFPRLVNPQWNLGYSIIIHKELRQRRWMEENLESIATIIDADKFLYVTTNDAHDMTLIKLRFQEYHAEPAIT